MSPEPIRVFLVDDHELVRRGLRDLLEADGGIEVVGEAGTASQALTRIPATRPDVAVLDLRLPDGDGVSLARDVRDRTPDVRCLMLTSFSDDEALLGAVLAGASGYLLKQVRGSDLVNAVRAAAAGRNLFDRRAVDQLTNRLHGDPTGPVGALSPQERKVLDLIGEGLTNRQIAQQMQLAEKTVKNYVSNLLAKLNLQRRTQAAVIANDLRHQAAAAG